MEPLTGVLSQIDVPESCPTCGAEVESAYWPTLTGFDALGAVAVRATSKSMRLSPCGHSLGDR